VQQSGLLDLLSLGPVRESILKHLSSADKMAMTRACQGMRREASAACKIKTLVVGQLSCPMVAGELPAIEEDD
jgi:hypothetical protein